MHIADGVLSLPVAGAAGVGAAALLAYSVKGTKEEEVPQISLMTGAFFVFSLIHIPLGPTAVHPVAGGLLGIMLGRRAPLAVLVGLLLQAILFQHGGISTLGVNLLLIGFPAFLIGKLFYSLNGVSVFWRGLTAGGGAVILSLALLVLTLTLSDYRYGEGFLSLVNILMVSYIPVILIEAGITGFAIKFIYQVRPQILQAR